MQLIADIGPSRYRQYFRDPCKVVRVDVDVSTEPDVCGIMNSLPFKNRCFDSLYASHILEHTDKPKDAAMEFIRIVKSGGRVAFFVPNMSWVELQLRSGVVDDEVIGLIFGKRRSNHDIHKAWWTPETWDSFISELPIHVMVTEYWRNTIMTWGIVK